MRRSKLLLQQIICRKYFFFYFYQSFKAVVFVLSEVLTLLSLGFTDLYLLPPGQPFYFLVICLAVRKVFSALGVWMEKG